jgi:hypothetical protein
LAAEVQAQLHLMPPCQGLEPCQDFILFQSEMRHAPLHPHEKKVQIFINVLLQIQDVPLVGRDEAGDIMHQAGLVWTVDEQGGGIV